MGRFIESIRIENGEPKLLQLHQQRVASCFMKFSESSPLQLHELIKSINVPSIGLYKWRVVYDLEANFTTEVVPYIKSEIKDFQLIEAPAIEYAEKRAERAIFQHLKNIAQAQEIIITQEGYLTDTSFSNLIFKKGKDWFTPKTYLLNGVMRQHLLNLGKVRATDIHVDHLQEYEGFQLINAMRPPSENFYPMDAIL